MNAQGNRTQAAGGLWAEMEAVPLEERLRFRNIHEMLQDVAAASPDSPALSFQLEPRPNAPSVTLRYAELLAEVNRAANLFRSLGAGPGSAVGILLPNLPQTVVALLAAATASVAVPINPLLSPDRIAAILREAGASVLVSLAPMPKADIHQRAAAALALAPSVQTLLEVDVLRYLTPPKSWLAKALRPRRSAGHGARTLDFDQARAEHRGDALAFDDPGGADDTAACFHTGGTTGLPKLARHTQRNMLFMGWVTRELLYRPGDVTLCALPLFHCFGAYVTGVAAFAGGVHTVLLCPAGFRAPGLIDEFWALSARWKANFFLGVPTVFVKLAERPVKQDLSAVRYAVSGSAALPTELLQRFEEKSGIRVLEGYGQTETTCVVSCNPPEGERRVGSVGLPLPYTEVTAVHADGRFVEPGQVGEIVVRGPNVIAGYVRESLNAELFLPGGWLRTGDLGRLDGDGYIWIAGRRKDIIIRGGHNIDPAEIEEALEGHPAVAFAAAVGRPDRNLGEMPFAFVELFPGHSADGETLRELAAAKVGDPAARPAAVRVMNELPKTAIGKIFKPDLRKLLIREVALEAVAEVGADARVDVEEDPEAGLRVVVTGGGEAEIAKALAGFGFPWRQAE